jgi:hypothetical protein
MYVEISSRIYRFVMAVVDFETERRRLRTDHHLDFNPFPLSLVLCLVDYSYLNTAFALQFWHVVKGNSGQVSLLSAACCYAQVALRFRCHRCWIGYRLEPIVAT